MVTIGDLVLVRSGANGSQVAEITELPSKPTDHVVRVQKWRHSSGQWAKRARLIPAADVLGVPDANDERVRKARAEARPE